MGMGIGLLWRMSEWTGSVPNRRFDMHAEQISHSALSTLKKFVSDLTL